MRRVGLLVLPTFEGVLVRRAHSACVELERLVFEVMMQMLAAARACYQPTLM